MCYKLCLITLSVLVCGLHSAAVDQSQLVVEKQPDSPAGVDATTVVSVPEQCHQPKETGRCFALFYRFAYNLDTQACEEFVYGGCAGNSNNFDTKEQCEQLCLGKSAVPSTEVAATELATELTTVSEQATETTSSSSRSASD